MVGTNRGKEMNGGENEMNDQYKLKLGLEWWEDQTEDPIGEDEGPHLSDGWRWKAMQDSIAAYGLTAEAVEWLGKALTMELKNGGKTLKAIEEIGKIGPEIWNPRLLGEKYMKEKVDTIFVGDGILERIAAQDPEELRKFLGINEYTVLVMVIEAARKTLKAIGRRPEELTNKERKETEGVVEDTASRVDTAIAWGFLVIVVLLVTLVPILCTC